MKKLFLALATISIAISSYAVDVTPPGSAASSSASLNSLEPASGTARPARSGKVNYDSLSRADKIKYINERHAANAKKAEAKWKSMNDDQKIAQFEKRRSSFLARRAKTQSTAASAAPAAPSLAPAAGVAAAPAATPAAPTAQ